MSNRHEKIDNLKVNRNSRVKKLKKIIVTSTLTMLAIMTFLCILSFIRIYQLEKLVDSLSMHEEEVNVAQVSSNSGLSYVSDYGDKEAGVLVNPNIDSLYDYKYQSNDVYNDSKIANVSDNPHNTQYIGKKKIYLTFDDGPSINTNHILDVLDEYGIKATFFVTGHEGFEAQYLRIVGDGHAIGMHSFTHVYKDVYKDLDSFADDLYRIHSYIEDVTGVDTHLYRFPGGSSNTVGRVAMKDCIEYLEAKDITYYDWNVSSEDAVTGGASVNSIVNNVINQINSCDSDTVVVLMHDCGDKSTTVEALPIIIEKIANMDNVVLLPITDSTEPIQHILTNR